MMKHRTFLPRVVGGLVAIHRREGLFRAGGMPENRETPGKPRA
jgi:hypothetical protein